MKLLKNIIYFWLYFLHEIGLTLPLRRHQLPNLL